MRFVFLESDDSMPRPKMPKNPAHKKARIAKRRSLNNQRHRYDDAYHHWKSKMGDKDPTKDKYSKSDLSRLDRIRKIGQKASRIRDVLGSYATGKVHTGKLLRGKKDKYKASE